MVNVCVRLDEDCVKFLDNICKDIGVNRSEYMRMVLNSQYAQYRRMMNNENKEGNFNNKLQ